MANGKHDKENGTSYSERIIVGETLFINLSPSGEQSEGDVSGFMHGGYSGNDTNGNGILDADEVLQEALDEFLDGKDLTEVLEMLWNYFLDQLHDWGRS